MEQKKQTDNNQLLWKTKNMPFFWIISILFGVIYTICRYKNPIGLLSPFFIIAIYVIAYFVLKRLGKEVKQLFWFYAIVSLLIGFSTVWTADPFIHFLNNCAILVIGCVFVLHQSYDDLNWSIGKYFSSIIVYLLNSIGCVRYSISDVFQLTKLIKKKKYKNAGLAVGGMLLSIPLLMLVVTLLAQADAIFASYVDFITEVYIKPQNVYGILIQILFFSAVMYAFIISAGLKPVKSESNNPRKGEPIVMITCMSIIAFVYLFFSGIQIIYLFLGKGILPVGITYSTYAREGFFQLLFVALLNFILVLCCLKYVRTSIILNFILTVISVCTYILICSAGYRMILYIKEYQLTVLRVQVLWFLVLLSVLMGGVVVSIYHNRFHLFHYSMIVFCIFYIGYAWMRPHYLIADYNIKHSKELDYEDITYLLNDLSADAFPAIMEIKVNQLESYRSWDEKAKKEYAESVFRSYQRQGLRDYHYSYKIVENYLKER